MSTISVVNAHRFFCENPNNCLPSEKVLEMIRKDLLLGSISAMSDIRFLGCSWSWLTFRRMRTKDGLGLRVILGSKTDGPGFLRDSLSTGP